MNYDAYVPWSAELSKVTTEGVRATKPVLASNLQAAGQTSNWLVGKGRAVAVDGPRRISNSEAGVTKRFRYWVHGNEYCTGYQVMVTISAMKKNGAATAVIGTIKMPIGGGSTGTFVAVGVPTTYMIHVPRSYPPSAASEEISFELDASDLVSESDPEGQIFIVHCVHIFESYQIRVGAKINPGSYAGVDWYSLSAKSPIYDGAPFESIAGLSGNIDSARQYFHRRGCLFSWTSPFLDSATAFYSSTSYLDLFQARPPLQSFLTTSGQTARTVKVNIYAKADNGSGSSGSADVRISTLGSTISYTVNTNTFGWRGERDINVLVDDPSQPGWVRGSRDLLRVEVKANTSGHRVWVHAISVHDLPG